MPEDVEVYSKSLKSKDKKSPMHLIFYRQVLFIIFDVTLQQLDFHLPDFVSTIGQIHWAIVAIDVKFLLVVFETELVQIDIQLVRLFEPICVTHPSGQLPKY